MISLFGAFVKPFQFTPLREGGQHAPPVHHAPRHFNSRPSARGDLYYPPFGVMQLISIHAPPRGATNLRNSLGQTGQFQFTPLREGRPEDFTKTFEALPISIHAPPRGATRCEELRRPG